jgi:hypothetical protein
MHRGKDPWLKNKLELEKSFPIGNLKRFHTLRYEKDPLGIFLNDFFSEIFEEKMRCLRQENVP